MYVGQMSEDKTTLRLIGEFGAKAEKGPKTLHQWIHEHQEVGEGVFCTVVVERTIRIRKVVKETLTVERI